MIFSNSDVVYDILFFAGTTQIYKPVFRICGGVLVNSNYTAVLTNKTRALGLDDFTEKRLPTSIGHNSFFSGDLIARSNNGVTYNIVDNLELLNSELLTSENVTLLSCTAASDSWIITTDNARTPFQVIATPAYNPSVIGALSKLSPAFTGQTAIATDENWDITTGWRTSKSSIYDNNGSFIGWKATDRVDGTYWASGITTYTSSGVGNQWVQMEFPSAVKIVSHTINPRNTLNVGVPRQWTLSGSNNNSSFANKTETFITTQSHVAYKYWRVTITLIRTAGAAIHAVLYDLAFNTGWSIAQPVDLTTFKLVLGNSYDTPLDWQFNIMLLKNNKIVNSGLYNLSLVNATSSSWVVETDNTPGEMMQCLVSPSLSPDSLNVFTDDSPTFTNNINIINVPKSWRNADGWRVVTSSTFQNNPLYAANAAMDKRVDTWWGSSEVKMASFRLAGQRHESLIRGFVCRSSASSPSSSVSLSSGSPRGKAQNTSGPTSAEFIVARFIWGFHFSLAHKLYGVWRAYTVPSERRIRCGQLWLLDG
ncbi:hypothetical protein T492DRAFT_836377 [Pavlovales sp. CCMP2436]|nr:hypothetical protein T492DRAFT_836377 [Pavlovales sp. CCMP2436]